MTRYRMTTSVEADGCFWYGITAQCGSTVAAHADSLTRDWDAVNRLTQQMNERQVSLDHFMDLIEDFLADCRR